ncbi:MAG: aspartate aminotransferase family protein [Candidatus Auribacterota bacterium]|jgi:predicted acetylornithine/succinylornithine family transaminase|nr:aspartate aminotransferase family protein [Candidatus Auribacterota bacterium]
MFTTEQITDYYKHYVLPTYGREGQVMVRGEGSYLFDAENKKYLDLYPGWGTGCLGHCHPYMAAQLADQLKQLIHVPNNYYNPWQGLLAKRLAELSFGGFTFFANSGAEANEGAIKLARRFGNETGGRYEIITFLKSFHGRTLATITATGQPKYQKGFEPLPAGFVYATFGDFESLKNAVTGKTCAIMMELIQGEGGVNMADKTFYSQVQQLCTDKNLLLILDEVQTGMGRTGDYFGYQTFSIDPHVVTLAKSLGGGFPIGAMMVKPEYSHLLPAGTHASTYGGNPLACRASLAVLDVMEKESILENVKTQGAYLRERITAMQKSTGKITDIRGIGLMAGVDVAPDAGALKLACREKGVLINAIGEHTIRFLPALNITRQELAYGLDVFEQVLTEG